VLSIALQISAASLFFFDSGFGVVFFLFFLSGFVFYGWVYLRYRNTNKHHDYVSETSANIKNMRESDQLVKRQTGLTNTRMPGSNDSLVEGSLVGGISKYATQVTESLGGATGTPGKEN
jgi:hypothetical protein